MYQEGGRQAEEEAATLRAFRDRVAAMDPHDSEGVCWCGEGDGRHAEDCLWLAAQQKGIDR